MTNKDHRAKIRELASKEGIFTTAQAKRFDIPRDALSNACSTGVIKRLNQGAYQLVGTRASINDELIAIWKLIRPDRFTEERARDEEWDGICIGGETAASIWGSSLSVKEPYRFYSPKRFNSRKKKAIFKKRVIDLVDVSTVDELPITSRERTIVDLILDKVDHTKVAQIFNEFRDDDFDMTRLQSLLNGYFDPDEVSAIIDALTHYSGNSICEKCWISLDATETTGLCPDCNKSLNRKIAIAAGGAAAAAIIGGIIFTLLSKADPADECDEDLDCADFDDDKDAPTDFLTSSDREMLQRAVDSGDPFSGFLKGALYELEQGIIQPDVFLRSHGLDEIVDEYPDWRDNFSKLSDEDFAIVLEKAKADTPHVDEVDPSGKHAHVTISSNSGKTDWTAGFDFDDIENIHLDYATYPYAGVIKQFIRNVVKWSKYYSAQQD